MTYGSETRPLLVDVGLKFERADMQMSIWMCGISMKDRRTNEELSTYITANIPNTPMQHGYKTQHSTVTALHTLNNTVAKGFNQMAPPARTITVALDMSKASTQ